MITNYHISYKYQTSYFSAVPIDKPNYTILGYQASSPIFGVTNCSRNSNMKTENMVSRISLKDYNEVTTMNFIF